MSRPITLDRLAETEYVELADPNYTTLTPFGTFYHHPEFPKRQDANQLMRTVLPADAEPESLLEHLEALYSGTTITHHKMSGHDPSNLRAAQDSLSGRSGAHYLDDGLRTNSQASAQSRDRSQSRHR